MTRIVCRTLLISVVVFVLMGCAGTPNENAPDPTLNMALLPILDVLPFYVAQENGYFEEEGVQIELIPIQSAPERDALLQSGEADGALTDLQSVVFFNQDSPQVQVVAKARKAYPEFPHFRIVAAPGFEVATPEDMANVPVGISENTIIDYLNDRLLTAWGVPEENIVIEAVPAIPVRFELLLSGQLNAALLPDPQAQAAIAAGGSLIVDDAEFPDFSQSVLAFTTAAIESKPETIEAFMRAWNRAVADINADRDAFRNVLIENTRVPESIQDTYNIPQFPEGEITSEAEWADVVEWAQANELLDAPVSYESSVNTQFVR